jgi:hypothetical protein
MAATLPPVPPLTAAGFQDPVWARWLDLLRKFVAQQIPAGGLTVTAPLTSTGGANPTLGITAATGGASGFLTSTDWNTFNNKLSAFTYSFTVVVTGFSLTVANGVRNFILNPAALIDTGTVKLAASPADGETCTIATTQTITAFTVLPNTGQTVDNAPTTLVRSPNPSCTFLYRAATTTWYCVQRA